MTIDELLERYGQLMHEAGEVKGELKAKLHLAKEFADIPEKPQIQVSMFGTPSGKFNPIPAIDLIAIPPSERIEWDRKYQDRGSLAGMIMRTMKEFPTRPVDTGTIYAKALQLYPDRTFNKERFQQSLYDLANNNLIDKPSRGLYKHKEESNGIPTQE